MFHILRKGLETWEIGSGQWFLVFVGDFMGHLFQHMLDSFGMQLDEQYKELPF